MTLNPTKPGKQQRLPSLDENRELTVNLGDTRDQTNTLSTIPILSNRVVNVSSVPQRSPLRYPGGKTWLVPQIRHWLANLPKRPVLFIEPFAGGATASLTAVMDGLVDNAVLCEIDPELSNLWTRIFEDADELAARVERFVPTPSNVRRAFNKEPLDELDLAFNTLLKNRINRGGIIAKGASKMNSGENGKGLASRWYANTIAERIRAIGRHASRFDFIQDDGLNVVERYKDKQDAVFFIDPPYTVAGKRAGKRLYNFNEIDHQALFDQMSEVRGQFMMTYDENREVVAMAKNRQFRLAKVAMKNTHHEIMYELLITSHELLS